LKVITFGTFDVFHVGHVNLLRRAAGQGDSLVVGVSTDKLNMNKKARYPIYSENDRVEIVSTLKFVDYCFLEHSLEHKRDYIIEHGAQKLVMGDDWLGKFDYLSDICEVIYLPRTPSISTTEVIEVIVSSRER